MNTLRRLAIATLMLLAVAAAVGAGTAGAVTPGVVKVQGWATGWSYDVNLNSLGGPSQDFTVNGAPHRGWPLRRVVEAGASGSGKFTIATTTKFNVSRQGKSDITIDGFKLETSANDGSLPIYFLDGGNTWLYTPDTGAVIEFATQDPIISVPRSKVTASVKIDPKSIQLKEGDKRSFKANVSGANGATVSYIWTVDRQVEKTGSDPSFSFKFDKAKVYTVAVTATVSGTGIKTQNPYDEAKVTVGKAPDKKKKKKKDSEPQDQPNDYNYDPGYVPGYTDGYGGGYGGGTGSSSNGSAPNPGGKKKKQDKQTQPPVDDGLETVSGQLIDPGTTATVIPPSDSSDPGTEQATPADQKDDKGGLGISKGAATALGIGALLGLGGLAEAGAFAGFGRFRFRP